MNQAARRNPAPGQSQIHPTAEIDAFPGRLPEAPPAVIGAGATVRSGSVIYRGSVIGDRLETGHNVVIREENVIGDGFSIWSNSVVDYGCRIGNAVKVHCNVYIAQFTVIEDGVFIGPNAVLTNDLVPGNPISAASMRGPTLRRGAQIGAGAVLLPFIEVGERALVGAGSVVTKNVPAGAVVVGNPARVIGRVEDLARKLERDGVSKPDDLA